MATTEIPVQKPKPSRETPANGSLRKPPQSCPPVAPIRMVPSRMVRFGIVGGIGILVNLLALAMILQVFNTRAWWASATANFLATLHNYIVNNLWTFRDCSRRGSRLLRGCFIYFGVATLGIFLTTVCYSVFNRIAADVMEQAIGSVPAWVALLSQLAAVLVGTSFNYLLNRTITWRLDTQPIE